VAPPLNPATVNIKLLTEIRKIYNNNKKKYSGKKYDFLNVKLQIFYNCCMTIGLPNTEYAKAFSCMLKRCISLFYYNKITGRGYNFEAILIQMREHFKTKESYQKYLSEWQETILQKTISENSLKTRSECFQIMVDKLLKVQQGLTREY
jgi:hypothetical protein